MPRVALIEGAGWYFHCPGCKCGHVFPEDGRWRFSGDVEWPTFEPSLVNNVPGDPPQVCHLFLRSGVLQFLGDCTHELAGTSYTLPEIASWSVGRLAYPAPSSSG